MREAEPAPTPLGWGTVRQALSSYRGHLPRVGAIAAFFSLPPAAVAFWGARAGLGLSERLQALGLLELILGTVATLAYCQVLAHPAGSGDPLGRALLAALGRWGEAAPAFYVSQLVIEAGFVLLVVPGLIAAAGLSLAAPLLALSRLDGPRALRVSLGLARGRRLRLLVLLGPVWACASALSWLAAWMPGWLAEIHSPAAVGAFSALGLQFVAGLAAAALASAQVACLRALAPWARAPSGLSAARLAAAR